MLSPIAYVRTWRTSLPRSLVNSIDRLSVIVVFLAARDPAVLIHEPGPGTSLDAFLLQAGTITQARSLAQPVWMIPLLKVATARTLFPGNRRFRKKSLSCETGAAERDITSVVRTACPAAALAAAASSRTSYGRARLLDSSSPRCALPSGRHVPALLCRPDSHHAFQRCASQIPCLLTCPAKMFTVRTEHWRSGISTSRRIASIADVLPLLKSLVS